MNVFSSVGCRNAAGELRKSSTQLDNLLNVELSNEITRLKNAYQSEAADTLAAELVKVKAKFPELVSAIEDCSKYLTDTVAPAYERQEAALLRKIG